MLCVSGILHLKYSDLSYFSFKLFILARWISMTDKLQMIKQFNILFYGSLFGFMMDKIILHLI